MNRGHMSVVIWIRLLILSAFVAAVVLFAPNIPDLLALVDELVDEHGLVAAALYVVVMATGIAPFAYVMVAMGGALATGAWGRLTAIGLAGALFAGGAYALYRRITRM